MKTEEEDRGSCPFTSNYRFECIGDKCALWNPKYKKCSIFVTAMLLDKIGFYM